MSIDYTSLVKGLFPPSTEDGEPPIRLRTMTVAAVNADGTVDLTTSGVTLPGVPRLDGAAVAVDAQVQVATFRGGLLVLGAVSDAAPGAWTDVPSFGTNWANYGGVWAPARYRKDSSSTVHLEGMLRTNAAANTNVMFTLPAGFRPSHPHLFPIATETNARFRLYIGDNGIVTIYVSDQLTIANNTFFSLAGVTFTAV